MSQKPKGQSTPLSPPNELGGSQRLLAVLVYVLPLLGGLLGLAIDRGNSLTRVHAAQSIGALLTMALSLALWAIAGYLLALVPVIGPIVSISLFSLAIAMAIFLAVNWIISLWFALRGEERTIPLANRVTQRLFGEAGA